MADDDDVRGAPGPEELLSPTGPRRSSFTPASTDAESLQAASNLFDDDAIAEALSAELARVASGPIPIQQPAAVPPVQDLAPEPVEDVAPEPVEHAAHEPVEKVAPEPADQPAASQVDAPQDVEAPVSGSEAVAESLPVSTAVDDERVPDEQVPDAEEVPAVAAVHAEASPEPETLEQPESKPEPEPIAEAEPEPVAEAEPEPEPVAEAEPEPEPVAEAEPELAHEPEPGSVAEALPEPQVAEDPELVEQQVSAPEPQAAAEPQGPPDWATPLFGQTTAEQAEPAPSASTDPFAPSAPPFAPSSGPFPPPGDSLADDTPLPIADPDALRALYAAAPAPTVAAADAPPPPGYGSPEAESTPDDGTATLSAIEQLQAQLDERDRDSREYAAWESSMLAVGTPEAVAAVDAARAERAGTSPEQDAPPSAFMGTPVEEPAAQLPPPFEEPVAFLPPPVEEPAAFLPPPVEEPAAFLAPPTEESAVLSPPPAEEPAAYLAPPPEDPATFLPPPAEDLASIFAPPVQEPAAFFAPPADESSAFIPAPAEQPAAFPPPADESAVLQPPTFDTSMADFAPPVEEPAASFGPPAEAPAVTPPPFADDSAPIPPPATNDPFDIFAASVDHQAEQAAPVSAPTPFPGFAPPTDSSTTDFAAPADPHELRFDQHAAGDAPVFLEPEPAASVPSAPSGPPWWNLDLPVSVPSAGEPSPVDAPPAETYPGTMFSAQPTSEEQAAALPAADEFEAAGSPPTLVEPPTPDGVADLWRTASEPSVPVPVADSPTPAPESVVPTAPDAFASFAAPTSAPEADAAPPSVPVPQPTEVIGAPPPSAALVGGFDDLLSGGAAEPDPGPPTAAWSSGEPDPGADPPGETAVEDRRPFGEGVERDEAVDPSDSIFGAPAAPVSVNTAGVAIAPELVIVESRPITVIRPAETAPQVVLVRPPIVPAEPVGLEPTPVEQRVGRAARLFWLWFAANSSIAAIVFGAILFELGMSLRQAVVATLAGVALSFIPLGLGTLAGKRSGQPTMVISRATFGVVGNVLPAIIALFSRLFWAAGLLWVLGAGTADILTGAKLTDGFTEGQLTIIVMAIGFVIAVVIAYFGYALIALLQLVISVISGIAIVGFIALTVKYVDLSTALSTPDGRWILVVTGAVLVFSFVGLAWANSSADVARYQRSGSSGAASMLWASFGVALPSFVLIAYGTLLAASNATLAANIAANPLDSLGRLLPVWYPGPLLAATVLSLLSGIVLALYSGGFALQAAGVQLRRSLSTLIVGVVMLLIAMFLANSLTNFSELFRDFATTVAVPVAAWAGIFGAEIMVRKRRFDTQSLLNRGGIYADARWGNLIALVVITVIGYGFLSARLAGLTWEGYLFGALGVPLNGQLAGTDLGVLVSLVLGLLFPLITGRSAINAQEKAVRVAE